ncbi:monovalent cation:H+ antiporter, CPA1 (nhx1) [Chytridiales sp. JEL 0842]|nr:monovalent cation:H+ antiporter, CPA1 (nhx1) [Chytridiales sp. JEL 0842]
MKVDPKLFSVIFGESILNDSVAIVLFGTLRQFNGKEVTILNVIHGIGSFMAVFFGSLMIGVIIALICSLMLKHSHLHEYPSLESCIIFLLAYSSYLLSNSIQLSGIVSLLFCGITLKHYAYDNMSLRSRRTTKYMWRVLSQLSENFIFIYLGVTLFTKEDELYLPGFIFFTLIIVLIARYCATIPLAQVVNAISRRFTGREADLIPRNHQIMLWWAGLRGAVAFALSYDVTGESAKAIRTTTLVVCVVSIIGLGGTTNYALEMLKVKLGVGKKKHHHSGGGDEDDEPPNMDSDEDTDSSEEEVEDWDDDLPGSRTSLNLSQRPHRGRHAHSTNSSSSAPHSPTTSFPLSPSSRRSDQDDGDEEYIPSFDKDMTHWFISFDDRWLKPLFTRPRHEGWDRRREGRASSPSRMGLLSSDAVGSGTATSEARRRDVRTGSVTDSRGITKLVDPNSVGGVGSKRGFGRGPSVGPSGSNGGASRRTASSTHSPNLSAARAKSPVRASAALATGISHSGSSSKPSSSGLVSTALNSLTSAVGGVGRSVSNLSDGDDESYVGSDGTAWSRPIVSRMAQQNTLNIGSSTRSRHPSGGGVELDGLSSKGK